MERPPLEGPEVRGGAPSAGGPAGPEGRGERSPRGGAEPAVRASEGGAAPEGRAAPVRRPASRAGAGCRGNGPSPREGCRPGGERPVDRPGSGPTPRARRPGNGSAPPAERSGNGSRTPVGSPGSGRRRPGAAEWPRCLGSGPPCAGSRRSAGVPLGAGRCHRPRRSRAGGSRPPPPHPNHVRGSARPPDRSRVRGSARLSAGILARSRPDRPPDRGRAHGRAWARPDRRNSGCSPECSRRRPYPGGVRPGSCPESGKAPRTGEAACWGVRAHPPPVAAEGGVARSDRSRPRARDPGGAGEPRSLTPDLSRTEGPSRAHRRRTDTCPGRSRTPRRLAAGPGPSRRPPRRGSRCRGVRCRGVRGHGRRVVVRRYGRAGRTRWARGDGGATRFRAHAPPFPRPPTRRSSGRPTARGEQSSRIPGTGPADGPPRPRASHTRGSGSASPSRSSLRARHSTGWPRSNGNQSADPRLLPGTSPYPAVIMSGRLRA